MSWIEKIQNELIITTGDSEKFRPSWLNATRSKVFNTAKFEFPKLSGSKIDRGTPMGTEYSLEIYFQGEDHLDTALLFWNSADDSRPWTIEHPLYGSMTVQPMSLMQDNTQHNISKITGTIIETIVDDAPRIKMEAIDTIKINKVSLDDSFVNALTVPFEPADITTVSEQTKRNYRFGIPVIKLPEQLEEYTNLFNKANSAINQATQFPLEAMRTSVALISYPSLLTQSVQSRIDLLINQFNTLRTNVIGLATVSSKQIYQIQAGTTMSSMVLAAVTPLTGDYKSSIDALRMMKTLLDIYDVFLDDMDDLQSDNGGSPDSFVPDANAMIQLNSLVNLAVASLFGIALSSRKERFVICEKDTNIILLTHRFYGLDPLDANINELMENNKIGLNQLLQIKKGTKIVYYV